MALRIRYIQKKFMKFLRKDVNCSKWLSITTADKKSCTKSLRDLGILNEAYDFGAFKELLRDGRMLNNNGIFHTPGFFDSILRTINFPAYAIFGGHKQMKKLKRPSSAPFSGHWTSLKLKRKYLKRR
jgi:hypothetical protein